MKIKIKYHTDSYRIKKLRQGDWYDLCAAEEVYVKEGDCGLISLGISVELPKGYEMYIVPRSSTFKTWGLIQTNSMGIVDESFCGDNDIIRFPYLATREIMVIPGDRICQFRIVEKQPELDFEEVEILGNEDRGGFGSTGRR